MDPALQELLESGEATDEVAVVIRLREPAEPPPGLRIVARLGPIATARVERAAIWQIYGHPGVASLKAPRWLVSEYGPLIDRADAENVDVADTDQRRPDGLKQTGRGTVVGVIDWGCDFAHPDFIEENGTSRLQALWDQRTTGVDTNPYGYGRVLRRGELTAAVKAGDPYLAAGYHPARSDTGIGAHGTHVLGIAAGNGRGDGPLGLAPEADLLFVHLGAPGWEKAGPLGDSSNLLEAIHFIVAEAGDRPLVINMSIGRHAGPHDGTTLVEQAIDWLVRARPGTAVVQSTGNYFSRNVHSAGQLINGEVDELAFETYAGDTTPNELEVWYPGSDVFRVGLIAPDGKTVANVKQGDKAPILVDGARVGTLYHRARDPNNGDHHIDLFQYPNTPSGTWRLVLTGEDVSDGRYHAWLERDPGCRACQALFTPSHADYTATTGSICNGLQTIAVGAYDGHHPGQRLAPFSSSGPTRDGRVRPVLLAPGVRVLAARSHPRQGTAPLVTRMSGTSMAAPHVTGTVALMFEAGGSLDIVQVRRALFESLTPVPSNAPRDRDRVGFGVLDTAGAVKRAAEMGAARYAAKQMTATALVATPDTRPSAARVPVENTPVGYEPDAASEVVPADIALAQLASDPAAEPTAPNSEKEIVMNPACCGDACKTCDHCQDQACETCPCCHPGAELEANFEAAAGSAAVDCNAHAAEIEIVPSPLEWDEANEPVVQVVPSPLEWAAAPAEWDEADEPQVQVVPSPLSTARETELAAAWDSTEAAVAEADEDAFEGNTEAGFPHPIDAAEALVEAGIDDSTEFVEQTLATTGRAWPSRCTVRSLFDDLTGRTTPVRRLHMDRHFEVVGRPGRGLSCALQAGDIVIRRGEGGFAYAAFIAHPLLYNEPDARAHGLVLESPWPGLYAHVVETGARPHRGHARFARRISRPDGTVLPDTLIVRARGEAIDMSEATEAAPDPNIRWLQSALNRAIGAGLVVDGLNGPATRDAVRRYQTARGLQVDGIVGPQTQQALRAEQYGGMPPAYGPPPYTPTPGPPYTPPSTDYPTPPSYTTPPYTPPDYPTPASYPPEAPPAPPGYTTPPVPSPYVPPPRGYRRLPPPSTYRRSPLPPSPTYDALPPPPSYATPPPYSTSGESFGTCRALDRFGYDSPALTLEHRTVVGELARRIVASGSTAVTVTGYTSPEGTPSYNLALGQRRAETIAAELRHAIDRVRPGSAARISITPRSEGEARQLSPDGPANRRVEVCYAEAPSPPSPPRPQPPGPRPQPPRPQPPRPQPPQVLVRHDIATPQGQAMLLRYEEAVRRMVALPPSNPSSWQFQWYIHAVRDDRSKANEINAIFRAGTPAARALANRVWDTCQAHNTTPNSDEQFFLPWHRMYVYYFERICRRVLNDPSFTLPYWNYTSGSTVLPAAFRNASSPLFRAARNAGPNRGDSLIDSRVPNDTLSAREALVLTNYSARGAAPGFNDLLDSRPHGRVHVRIGTSDRGMGSIEWAAQDPIFWLHHCNIDRIWASWNAAGRRNPVGTAWLSRRFPFADENGRLVEPVVRNFASTAALGYRYDNLEAVPAATPTEALEDEPTARPRRHVMALHSTAAPAGGILLGGQAIKVNLRRTPREGRESIEANERPRRLYLVLRNYRANVQPGVVYHVYLALPAGRAGRAAQQHYVGPLTFFDAVPRRGHGAHFVGRTERFDVTSIAERLRAAGMLDDQPSVTIAPAGQPPASAQPVIGEISLVEQ